MPKRPCDISLKEIRMATFYLSSIILIYDFLYLYMHVLQNNCHGSGPTIAQYQRNGHEWNG